MLRIIVILLILSIVHFPLLQNEREIDVAIYFSSVERYSEEIENAINYSWMEGGTKYVINTDIVNKNEVKSGKLSSYDVFIVPGSARPYMDVLDEKWREEVRKFVFNGGGYVGICGGANIASMGFDGGINGLMNPFLLKIANVYVNDEQAEEWQYLWKSNWDEGGVPVGIFIIPSDNPIFHGFYGEKRSIRYWGGPGMYEADVEDEKMGNIIPLAIYDEEIMDVAPLHYWKWRNGEWIPFRNVSTDLKGEYAAIATTYGKGRIVLFGPHPERETFLDGHIEEFPVRENLSPFTWFIYRWNGNKTDIGYNWWILRRSVAWAAGVSVPPASP